MVGTDIPMGVLVVSEAMVEVMVGTDTVVEGVVPSAAVVMVLLISEPVEVSESVVESMVGIRIMLPLIWSFWTFERF